MAASVRIVVSGIVQGVVFRQWTTRVAGELGVRGWVRNLYDGRVEIHAEGSEAVIAELVKRCHEGPRFAEVEAVTTREAASEGATSFSVRATA